MGREALRWKRSWETSRAYRKALSSKASRETGGDLAGLKESP